MNDKRKLQEIKNWYDKNYKLYESCAKEMSNIIEKILNKKNIPYHSISYRVKEKDSYLEKCKNDKYKNPIEEIMDLAGIRIITYTNKDVQRICEIVKKEFWIDEKNSEDKSKKMLEDQVGYLSVHYIVTMREDRTKLLEYGEYEKIKSEIQIRTLLQHAWAEIEHDRNYKFSGVLPLEIKRRFYLVAGVLEMMDREFDSLSEDIDQYSKEMQNKIDIGDFDVSIDSTSLEKYVLAKFEGKCIKPSLTGIIVNDEVIEELDRFGFKKIQDIENVLTEEMEEKLEINMKANTFIGLLRDMMMILDIDKYFDKAYRNSWGGTDRETVNQFQKLGINLQKYIEKYNLEIMNESYEEFEDNGTF